MEDGPSESHKIGKVAAHVPDLVVFGDLSGELPYTQNFHGVLLFADVSGFTALTEKFSMASKKGYGADQLTKTLNGYIGEIVDHVLLSGGDILNFAGDALLALWNVERKEISDVITLAAKCSLDIQKDCGVRNTEVGVELRVKIGISAGRITKVVVGSQHQEFFVVIGRAVDEVRLAEGLAEASTIILSPNAWELCDRTVIVSEKIENERAVKLRQILKNPEFELDEYLKSYGNHLEYEKAEQGNTRRASQLKPNDTLEATLRKYVMATVLQKIDDDQPLEYLSEMRPVTILFLNLQFTESATIQHQCQAMQDCSNVITKLIRRYNGRINKVFMFDKGCTFLCIFGLPGDKLEDECTHALRSAFKIHTFCTEHLVQIRTVSIGVTNGPVFCGVVGHALRHEYTVIGRKVNLAARMMMHYPGLVTCDEETVSDSKLPPYFFNELPKKAMKGVKNPGIIYEYLGDKENSVIGKSRFVMERDLRYPLLGREKEIELYTNTINNFFSYFYDDWLTLPRAVVFEGPPGFGKSRLLAEINFLAQRVGHRVVAMELAKLNIRQPFYTIQTMMAMYLRIDVCKTYTEREKTIESKMFGPEYEELLCLLNNLFFVKFPISQRVSLMDQEQKQQELQTFLMTIVEKDALEDEPLVLIIDQAHYIDIASWNFLAELFVTHPVFFIMTLGPYRHERPPCEAAMKLMKSEYTVYVVLKALKPSVIPDLACQTLGVANIPTELEMLLIERSYGIPYYCEELLKSMYLNKIIIMEPLEEDDEDDRELLLTKSMSVTASQAWRKRGERKGSIAKWQVLNPRKVMSLSGDRSEEHTIFVCILTDAVKLQNMPLPFTLKGIALAQLDHMSTSEQMVVKCASVIGQTFLFNLLHYILPERSQKKIVQTIMSLVKSRILECASPRPENSSDQGKKGFCFCPEGDSESDLQIHNAAIFGWPCKIMRFCTPLLQETAYELWLKEQVTELHFKCAEYLDKDAEKCSSCGGGDFIYWHRNAVDYAASLYDLSPSQEDISIVEGELEVTDNASQLSDEGNEADHRPHSDLKHGQKSLETFRKRLGSKKKQEASKKATDYMSETNLKFCPEETEEVIQPSTSKPKANSSSIMKENHGGDTIIVQSIFNVRHNSSYQKPGAMFRGQEEQAMSGITGMAVSTDNTVSHGAHSSNPPAWSQSLPAFSEGLYDLQTDNLSINLSHEGQGHDTVGTTEPTTPPAGVTELLSSEPKASTGKLQKQKLQINPEVLKYVYSHLHINRDEEDEELAYDEVNEMLSEFPWIASIKDIINWESDVYPQKKLQPEKQSSRLHEPETAATISLTVAAKASTISPKVAAKESTISPKVAAKASTISPKVAAAKESTILPTVAAKASTISPTVTANASTGIIGPLSTKPEAAISRRQLLHDYLHTLSKTSFSPVSSKQKVPPDDVPVEEDQISGSPGMSAVREERRQAKDGAARKRSSLQSQNVSSDLKNDNQPSTYRPGQETQKTVAATIPAATPTGIIGPLSNKPEASTNRKPLHQEKPLTIRSIMNFLDFDHIEEDVDAIRFEEEQMPLESTRISAFPEYKSLGKDGPAGERSSLLPQKELYDLRRDDQHSTPSLGRNTKKNLESVVPTMSVTSPTGKPGAPSSELKAVPSTSKRKPQFKDSLILPSKQSVEQNISTEKTKTMLHGPEKDMLSGSSKVDTPFAVKKGVLELLNTLSSTSNRQLSRDRSPLQQSKLSVSQVSRKEKVTAVAQVQEEKRPPGMSAIPGERAQGKGGTARKQSSVVPVKRGSMFHATRGSLFSQKSATAGKRSSIAPQKIGTARERNSLFIPKSGTASKRSSIFIPKSGTSSKSSSIFIPKSGTSSKRSSIFTPKSGTASKRSSLLPQQSVIASERSSLFSQLNGTARERSFLVTHKSVTGRERSSLSQRGIGLDYYKPLEPVLEVDVVPADTPTGVFSLVQNGSESDKPLTPQPTENGSKKSSDEEDEVVLYVEKHDILPSSLEISDIPDTDPKRSHRISLDDSSLPLYESLEIRNERNFHIFGGQFHDTVESAIPTVSEPAPTGFPDEACIKRSEYEKYKRMQKLKISRIRTTSPVKFIPTGKISEHNIEDPRTEYDFLAQLDRVLEEQKRKHFTKPKSCSCMYIRDSVIAALARHWLGYGDLARTIYFLLETAAAALYLSNNYKALSYVNEAEYTIDMVKNKRRKSELLDITKEKVEIPDFEIACLYRLKGEVLFNMGNVLEARDLLKKALGLLSRSFPFNTVSVLFKLVIEKAMYSMYERRRLNPRKQLFVDEAKIPFLYEQINCLSLLWKIFCMNARVEGKMRALLAVIMEVNSAEQTGSEDKLIMSYMDCVVCCQMLGFKDRCKKFEMMVIQHTVFLPETNEGLLVMAQLAQSMANTKLVFGELNMAVEFGYRSHNFAALLNNSALDILVLPITFEALFLQQRYEESIAIVRLLDEIIMKNPTIIAQAWFYTVCLEILLQGGFAYKSFEDCFDFVDKNHSNSILVSENRLMLSLFSSLALWFARLEDWDLFRPAYRRAKKLVMHTNASYLAIFGYAKFLECQALLLRKVMIDKIGDVEDVEETTFQHMEKFMSLCVTAPLFYDRALHMKAFILMLTGKDLAAVVVLQKGLESCKKHMNKLEETWIKLSSDLWFDGDTSIMDLWMTASVDMPEWEEASQMDMDTLYRTKFLLQLPLHIGEQMEENSSVSLFGRSKSLESTTGSRLK